MKKYLIRFVPVVEAENAHMFTAECKELGFAGSGYTPEEAKERVANSVRAYFAAIRRGKVAANALEGSHLRYEEVDVADNEVVILA